MRPLRFRNARVLGPEGWHGADLEIAAGRFAAPEADRVVDAAGYRLLPGIVDLHGDGFERHVAPRRGALHDTEGGLFATAAELAANGITTAYLAQFWSWEGGLRGPDFAEEVFAAWAAMRDRVEIDLRMQLRLETHMIDDFARAEATVAAHGIDYLVFNDHLQHKRLAEERRPKQMTGQALKSGRSPEAHFAYMLELHRNGPKVGPALDALAARLKAAGVRLGSHDDASAETRQGWRARGVAIAEFPETRAAAEAARAAGEAVIMGAPNVVRGSSHKRNVAAAELIAEGLCDALASDYHYPAPLSAVRRLVATGVCDWETAWSLVSEGPARVLGLSDRGRIAPGCRADLVVLDAEDRVAATFAGGQVAYMTGEFAARMLSS
ncbi:alpha-D-ribose 1-methylphosphonate 5-triphosphate diphosphatase [Roseivivax sp. GX 12232]|uniref:alpha-D-ribose 1-methylphosphonate 5-triphosphate diphosphatase n=1 Tax=Roseivivax sp. GX 12232 TaxID=2900547 RepID=UPI001E505145|nr:alpha-D-ribose 1-methylphosphonate 5-triphosphate diphosphatase [Roseivivax sp. GX 12232]MCE0505216.1 alpha-D-ribose 1-methylphosphonate 5-triphosphate diphosphatase [Roseivivax sp. GX 12232]